VLAQDDDTSSNDLLDDGDSLIPPDVIANKVNLQVMGDVNAKVNATALRIAASTFMAPNKDGSCKFWMNFWDDQTLMQGSLQVNLGRLPKLTTGQETSNFDFSGKQRFDLGFFASGQQEQYVFGKRQLMAGPVSELGNTVHDFHTKAGFRMKSGKLKLSLKNGDYIVGELDASLEGKMSDPKARPGTPPRTLRIAAKGDFALDLGSRGSVMDAISKGWQCQEYGFMEVKRYPEDRVRHFKADRPIIRINFSEDLQQESVNNESFKVGYPDAEGEFITVTGRFINDKSKIQFVPDKGLRKGVRYTVKLKVGEQGVRSARGVFIDDDSGTGWHESEFWTSLPFANQNDESSGLSCDVYQTVKNAPLILGKPALMKVYADWPRLDDVHTSAQYREFDALTTLTTVRQ